MNVKEKMLTSLRNELDAAREKLRKTPEKKAEIVGYIRGLQVAMVVINKNL